MVSVIVQAWKSFLRLWAQHTICPTFRIQLYRWSGIKIGKKAYINMNCEFSDDYLPDMIDIQDEVSIASFVSLVAVSDPNNSFIGKKYPSLKKKGKVTLKKGAWLGQGSVILPGITIGTGAVIGSNAVVTHNVPDFAIMAGIPAKKIGDVRER